MKTKAKSRRESYSSTDSQTVSNTYNLRTNTKRRARKSLGKTKKTSKLIVMESTYGNDGVPQPRISTSPFEDFRGFEAAATNPTAEGIQQILNNSRSSNHTSQSVPPAPNGQVPPPPTSTAPSHIPNEPWLLHPSFRTENLRYSMPRNVISQVNQNTSMLAHRTAQSETNQLLAQLIEKMDRGFNELRSQGGSSAIPLPPPPVSNPNINLASRTHIPTHIGPNNNYTPNHNTSFGPQGSNPDVIQMLSNQISALTERLNSLDVSHVSNGSNRTSVDRDFQAPPYRWTIRYNGDNAKLGVENFLMQVETLKKIHNYDWNKVLSNFHTFLEGDAVTWYYNYRALNNTIEWSTFKEAMLSAFGKHETDAQILGKLSSRYQGDKESFQKFYQDLQSLRIRLQRPYSDYEMIQLIRTNARTAIQQTLFTYIPTTLDDFVGKCRQLDLLLHPADHHSTQPQRYFHKSNKVSELEIPPELESHECLNLIDSLSKISPRTCWNCDEDGHNWIECDSPPKMFCYRCGMKNCTTRNCNQCASRRNFRLPQNPHESPPLL